MLMLYPNEYVYVENKFALNSAIGRVIVRPVSDTIVIKPSIPEGVSAQAVPTVVVGAFVGGALGVMSELGASGGSSSFRSIGIAAFSGAVAGGLAPVMGAGAFGSLASGSIGISAHGMCSSCHS